MDIDPLDLVKTDEAQKNDAPGIIPEKQRQPSRCPIALSKSSMMA